MESEEENTNSQEEISSSVPSQKIIPPLWNFVAKLQKSKGNEGGSVHFTCNFCQGTFQGSYSRVKAHLLGITSNGIRRCGSIEKKVLEMLTQLQNDYDKKLADQKIIGKSVSSGYETVMSALKEMDDNVKRKRVSSQPIISDVLKKSFRDELDAEIARMFYSAGLSFNLARNPHYQRAFALLAAACKIGGYTPPGYNVLRTHLLTNEKNRIDIQMQQRKKFWASKGVSLLSDGWSDPQRRPLINFIAINDDGPMFLQAVNCEGQVKSSTFIAKLMDDVIQKVGAQNVVQIITDNASSCRTADIMMETKHSQIFWTPCAVHTINLAVKNICYPKCTEHNGFIYSECSWIPNILESVVMIRNFITRHSMRLAMFKKHSKLQLLHIVDTRFASAIVMLRRFKKISSFLKRMVLEDEWENYRRDDDAKAKLVKKKLLDDSFWDQIQWILRFTEPLYDMIRTFDKDEPCLHLVYPMWLTTMRTIKRRIYIHKRITEAEKCDFWDAIHDVLKKRREMCITPLHAMAHSLNPRCATEEWALQNPDVSPPQSDSQIYLLRREFLSRFFPDTSVRSTVTTELASFLTCSGVFNDHDSKVDRAKLDPLGWWAIHGAAAPNLQKLAFRLLRQVSSSSCCERNWSTYAFIHSAKRNKLAPKRAETLVYVHTNLRLLSRKSEEYTKGVSKLWDIVGDGIASLTNLELLQFANLSLDESELEDQMLTTEIDQEVEEPEEEEETESQETDFD